MDWMKLLACPSCRGALSLTVFAPHASLPAREGVLRCKKCPMWYPITRSVPRLFVPGPLRPDDAAFLKKWGKPKKIRVLKPAKVAGESSLKTQAQVQSVFEFKWKWQKEWGIRGGAASFMENWVFEKYGWEDAADYRAFVAKKRVMLDAGCGLAREAMRMASANPSAAVIGIELSGCVDEARAHADDKQLHNLLLVQGDLVAPPFRNGAFDFVFSEGVLHHTASTRVAFERMAGLLGAGGEIAFYVYRKKAPLREYADDYVREKMQNISPRAALEMMESLTLLGKSLSDLKAVIEIPRDVPALGFQAGRYDLQRWVYNGMFKCFWNDKMSMNENVLVNFDWYLPKYAWRHTEQELREWAKWARMNVTREFVEDAGITMRAVKPKGK